MIFGAICLGLRAQLHLPGDRSSRARPGDRRRLSGLGRVHERVLEPSGPRTTCRSRLLHAGLGSDRRPAGRTHPLVVRHRRLIDLAHPARPRSSFPPPQSSTCARRCPSRLVTSRRCRASTTGPRKTWSNSPRVSLPSPLKQAPPPGGSSSERFSPILACSSSSWARQGRGSSLTTPTTATRSRCRRS